MLQFAPQQREIPNKCISGINPINCFFLLTAKLLLMIPQTLFFISKGVIQEIITFYLD